MNESPLGNLPPGWEWSSVRDILRNHDSQRIPVKKADRARRQGDFSYYGASGVIDSIDDFIFDGSYLLIGEDGANLLARSKPVAFQAHGRFWVNNHAHVLTTWADMPLGYFESFFNSTDLSPCVTGSAQPKLPQAAFNKIRLPIPPLPEQHRIVEAIESYLTRLDDAVASLERVQKNLKRYRASVLKAAVEGRLVPTEAELARKEGRDYEPASVLLERILKERRRRWEKEELAKMKAKGKEPKNDKWKEKYKEPVAPDTSDLPELPAGWVWTSVDQISDVTGGLTKNAKRATHPVKMPYLRVANVYAAELRLDKVLDIGVRESEVEKLLLRKGDLLIVEGNGSIEQLGRVAQWDGSIENCVHQNHLIKVRCCPTSLADWAIRWLLSPGGRKAIEREASSTSGLHTLSISKVQRLPVPLCPPSEQARIVDESDRLLSVTSSLVQSTTDGTDRAARLRQSILKWAFEGKLVDQDPTDEPASVLLERIKAERAALAAQKKTTSNAKRASRMESSRRRKK